MDAMHVKQLAALVHAGGNVENPHKPPPFEFGQNMQIMIQDAVVECKHDTALIRSVAIQDGEKIFTCYKAESVIESSRAAAENR